VELMPADGTGAAAGSRLRHVTLAAVLLVYKSFALTRKGLLLLLAPEQPTYHVRGGYRGFKQIQQTSLNERGWTRSSSRMGHKARNRDQVGKQSDQ
jgi:hypothetical protein